MPMNEPLSCWSAPALPERHIDHIALEGDLDLNASTLKIEPLAIRHLQQLQMSSTPASFHVRCPSGRLACSD